MIKKVLGLVIVGLMAFGFAFGGDTAVLTIDAFIADEIGVRFTADSGGGSAQTVTLDLVDEDLKLKSVPISTGKGVEVLANANWTVEVIGNRLDNPLNTSYISFAPRINGSFSDTVSGSATNGWEGNYEIFIRDLKFHEDEFDGGSTEVTVASGSYSGDVQIVISAD